MVTICCGSVNEGIKYIGKLCFEASFNFQYGSNEEKQLTNFAMYLSMKAPQISAANVLVINLSTFFSIMSVVITYFIIIVQMH